jgi:hypothetical protein
VAFFIKKKIPVHRKLLAAQKSFNKKANLNIKEDGNKQIKGDYLAIRSN